MAIESIAKTLGSGSGIDIGALVTSLVDAQFAAKNAEFAKREEKLTAQISGVSKLKGAITGLDAALKSLVTGGTLQSQLTSSNETAIAATRTAGAPVADVAAKVAVTQLASAQVSTTNVGVPANTAFRTGSLSLRFGSDVVTNGTVTGFTPVGNAINITIPNGSNNLAGIATRINAANAGVTARVVVDGANSRLSITGPSGTEKAFEIAATNTGGSGRSLAELVVRRDSTVTTSTTRARDAVVTVDGVNYNRTSNKITDLVPGVTLDLLALSATPVTIGTAKPSAAISEGVANFVAAYNEMLGVVREQNDPLTGVLGTDNAVRSLARGLGRLTTTVLAPVSVAGAPRTLADLGVATARDGTLSIDTKRLTKAVADFPAAVEAMFADGVGATGGGLSAALGAIVRTGVDRTIGLDASTATYTKARSTLTDAKLKLADQTASVRERLTRQFATMDARTAAYKSTQSFLDNQIKAWNRSDA